MKIVLISLALFSSVVAATNAVAGSESKTLTSNLGMALYTFDKDTADTSNCYEVCEQQWPPYLVESDTKSKKNWGIITRNDGSKQWTYNNKPLYTWVGDKKTGDVNGDGIGGVWHLAEKIQAKSRYGYTSQYPSQGGAQNDYSSRY